MGRICQAGCRAFVPVGLLRFWGCLGFRVLGFRIWGLGCRFWFFSKWDFGFRGLGGPPRKRSWSQKPQSCPSTRKVSGAPLTFFGFWVPLLQNNPAGKVCPFFSERKTPALNHQRHLRRPDTTPHNADEDLTTLNPKLNPKP